MKDLCARSRAALNLLLLLLLLQVWVNLTETDTAQTITSDVKEMAAMLTGHAQGNPTEAARGFIESYNDSLRSSKALNVQATSLARILKLSRDDIMSVRPTEEQAEAMKQRARESYRDIPFLDEKATARRKAVELARMRNENPFFEFEREQLGVAVKLQHIQDLVRESQLDPDKATVLDLGKKMSRELEAPFIKQPIETEDASWILVLANIAPLALLFVLLDSIWIVVQEQANKENDSEPESLDLILFYRSRWAFALGVAWLLAPAVMLVATTTGLEAYSNGKLVLVLVAFAATPGLIALSIWRAMQIRRAYVLNRPGVSRTLTRVSLRPN